jgi:hypothetical protein
MNTIKISICWLLGLLGLLAGQQARAQGYSSAKLRLEFGTSRASTTAGYREIDVLISAGTGYTSDPTQAASNTTNPNGSWTGLNFRFTVSGPAPWPSSTAALMPASSGISVINQQVGIGTGNVTYVTGGGSYPGAPAYNVLASRPNPNTPDATATRAVLFTIRYPNAYAADQLTPRYTTTQTSASRESSWSNTYDDTPGGGNLKNTGAYLSVEGNTAPTPLPVELSVFTATKQGADGQLRWTTASEKNAAYFEVQASADGQQYKAIGRVQAAGTSSAPLSYSLLDQRIARYGAPLVYYRLRQVDADGTASFSPLRTLAPDAAAWAVTAYPNPFAQDLSAQITGGETSPLMLELYDATGRRVLHRQVAGSAGQQLVDLRSEGLGTGAYVLHVRQGSHIGTVRLTKE